MNGRTTAVVLCCLVCGCGSLLPRSKEVTASPWQSYREAELAFDKIVPGLTTAEELKALSLDPRAHPNIAILSYADVLRRFLLNQSISLQDLDHGVRECISAKVACRGYEINQRSVRKHRNGSFWLDFLGFRREVHIAGWRFQGLILLKDGVVIYKLTSGTPSILEQEEDRNPLGPINSVGSSLFNAFAP